VNIADSDARLATSPRARPELLVSVRNAAEAWAAIAGGCDVLDVKEPDRGALGMADVSTIGDIISHSRIGNSSVPVSVALGDAVEWTSGRPVPRLPAGIEYLKLGTAGQEGNCAWHKSFCAAQQVIDASIPSKRAAATESTIAVAGGFATSWIAVAYADWQIARGPAPEEVIANATECNCSGILIDTFSKGRLRLFDWLDGPRLCSLAAQARSAGLTFALAGRLQIGDLPLILAAGPDIVGIRSAACRDGNRSGEIDAGAVRAFRDSLQLEFRL
jgi:uncharacterized protein (UPF0264 family)